mgnify:CR=1 FL=1
MPATIIRAYKVCGGGSSYQRSEVSSDAGDAEPPKVEEKADEGNTASESEGRECTGSNTTFFPNGLVVDEEPKFHEGQMVVAYTSNWHTWYITMLCEAPEAYDGDA